MLQLVSSNDFIPTAVESAMPGSFDPRGFAMWDVSASGDYASDCATGAARADDLIEYVRAGGLSATLGYAVQSITERGEALTGIEIGFFNRLAVKLQQL